MIAPDDPRVAAAMRHLDQRVEDGRCGQMVAEMLTAAMAVDAGEAAAEVAIALLQREIHLLRDAAKKLRNKP